MFYLNIAVVLVMFGAVPCAAADSAGSLSTDPQHAMIFVSSDAIALIVILLVLLIVLLLLAIIYMISTLIPKLSQAKKAKTPLHISETTKQQISRLMKKEGVTNRDEFVQKLIVEELSCNQSSHAELESIQEVVTAYVESPEAQEKFRRFVARSLLGDDEGDQRAEEEDVR
ncbi:hypothetical protein [Methanorbis furvi]|uniref:Uncharacterized protein n=1 Tax=Methanorbis furvi TaxID=3028299 RepID=A0AAE4MCB5_9EURY|nr:hypothetical protein [Methanocorpusculaceae archaeon Ag1]